MGFGHSGVERQCRGKLGSGGIMLAGGMKREGQIIVILGDGAVDANRLPEQVNGHIVPTEALGDHTQEPKCVGMKRILPQDFLVDDGRLLKTPGLMMADGLRKGLLDGGIRHSAAILAE